MSCSVFNCEIGGKEFFHALPFWVAGEARAGISVVKNAICILPLAVPEPPFGLQPNF